LIVCENKHFSSFARAQGVQVWLGGEVGEKPELGSKFEKAVPANDDELVPHLKELLISKFGATLRK
jgi:hypothetical protein